MSVRFFRAFSALALAFVAGCAFEPHRAHHPEMFEQPPQAQPQLAFAGINVPAAPAATKARPRKSVDDNLSFTGDPQATPAYHYANLDRDACEAELTKRSIPFVPVSDARGVLAPVRLTGPIRGIAFHSGLPERARATSPIEIFDCRLVLALDDFAAILAAHDVVEVIHMSVYRPPPKRWPSGKVGTRHDGALALDAGTFVRRDGTSLVVEKDFHGRIGARTCGPNTGPWPATPEAVELRHIVCETADAHLFQVQLTPDYNWPHRNHFHLEVTPNVNWFLVH
jgi:hypothetical protein